MASSDVIQGFFPHGLPRFAGSPGSGIVQQQTARPAWAMEAIARPGLPRASTAAQPHMAQPRAAATSATHAAASPPHAQQSAANAVRLPAHLASAPVSGGELLPPAVRQKMEAVFGTSFADVRVHVGTAARSIGALAYTRGSNLHFAAGHYDPFSLQGQRLLGHELAHVVQQRAGRVRNPFGAGVAVVHDQQMEAEAERMATRAVQSRAPVQAKRPTAIQCVTYRWDKTTETWQSVGDVTENMNAGPAPARRGEYKDEYVWVDDVDPNAAPAAPATPEAPTFAGVGSGLIKAEWQAFGRTGKPPASPSIRTTAGRVSGDNVHATARNYVQSGNSADVQTHAEQAALNEELKKTGDIHLIQNAWPCGKCLKYFGERSDLATRKVIITVTEDNGTYSKDNGFTNRHTIGQIIINKRVISYANVVTLA